MFFALALAFFVICIHEYECEYEYLENKTGVFGSDCLPEQTDSLYR